jgi:Fe-S-cluster-containing dehydrogenase component
MPCFSIRIAQSISTFAVRLARRNGADGIVDFICENCIGRGYCVKVCFDVPPISQVDHKSYKLRPGRGGVGLESACIEACPTGGIMFGSNMARDAKADRFADDLAMLGLDLLVAEAAGVATRATCFG